MNFKENYQREMNEIEKPSGITEKVLNAADTEQETYAANKNRNVLRSGAIWKTAVAAIAIACVLSLCLQHEKVISFAQSVLNRFTVSVNNEDMEFGKIEPIDMNIEAFIKDTKTEVVGGGEPTPSYYQTFTSYQEMKQLTQLELPCADKVEYRDIWLHIIPEYKTGYVDMQILYEGASYNVNGMFTLDAFDQKEWGYGTKGSKEVYQYGDEKKACFTKDSDGYETVYFVEGNILFQMSFNNGDDIEMGYATASKEQTKNLLKLFGQESSSSSTK